MRFSERNRDVQPYMKENKKRSEDKYHTYSHTGNNTGDETGRK